MARLVAGIMAGLLIAASVLAGAGSASAKDFGDIIDLFNYKLLKSGTELQAAMGPAAQAAWGAETARMATRSASAYNIAAATSGLTPVKPDPIYIRPQDLPAIKPTGGFKNFTTKFTGVGLNKPAGVGAAAVAMVGYEFRADIADGVTSLLGFDAGGLVCGDPTASAGFVNWITGQDCSQWKLDANYVPNLDGVDRPDGYASNIHMLTGITPERTHVVEWGPVTVVGNQLSVTLTLLKNNTAQAYGWYTFKGTVRMLCQASPGGPLSSVSLPSAPGSTSNPVGTTRVVTATCSTGVPVGLGLSSWPTTGSWWEGVTLAGTDANGPYSYPLWGAPGTDWWSPGQSSDPDRYWVCDFTGDDGLHYTKNSDTFKESSGYTAAVLCPDLPAGVDAVHMRVTLMGGPEPLIVSDEDALPDPLGDGSETNGVTTEYCVSNICVLELMDLRSGKSCFDEGDACDGWLQSPTRDTDYKCFYGGVEQDFKQCYVYAQVFNTAKRLDGHPYADPKTGDDVDVVSGLSIDELTMANEPRPAAFGRNCFGGDWGAANPVNWILRPIQCALEWAFVARPAVVQADGQLMADAWAETAPGKVVTAVGNWTFLGGSTGCQGPPVNIPFFGLSGYPLSACEGTMLASIAAPTRTLVSALMVLGAAFVVIRIVSGIIGFRGVDS